jgi:hypothetical protein
MSGGLAAKDFGRQLLVLACLIDLVLFFLYCEGRVVIAPYNGWLDMKVFIGLGLASFPLQSSS